MLDLFSEIWQTMRTNRLRTILTGVAVAWGILMLIVLLSVSNGTIASYKQNTSDMDMYKIDYYPGRTSMPYAGYKEGRRISFDEADIRAISQISHPAFDGVTATTYFRSEISTPRDYLASTWCNGVDGRDFDQEIIAGRVFNSADVREARKVVILPHNSLSTLFADTTDVVGRTVNAGGVAMTVIGVYKARWGQEVYIPYSTAQALTGFSGDVDNFTVHLSHTSTREQSDEVNEAVKRILRKRHFIAPTDERAFYGYNGLENYESNLTGMGYLNMAMWVIGILTLITGIVGVSNIMFVSVRERTHEIGIRRAIGAKPRNILTQVVLESVVMTTVFGYLGIVGGTLVVEAVKYALAGTDFNLPLRVDLGVALQVTIALIVAGALAGLFPAMRALKIKPVEALSEE